MSRTTHRNCRSDGVLSQQSPYSMLPPQVSPVSFPAPTSKKHGAEPNYRSSSGCSTTNTSPKNHGRVPCRRNPLCRRTDYGSSEYTKRLNIVFARLELVPPFRLFRLLLTSQGVCQVTDTIPHDTTRWCVLRIVTDVMGLTNGSFNILGGEFSYWEGSRTRKHEEYHLLLREDTFLLCK